MSNIIKNVFFHATMDCNNLNPVGKFFYGFADFDMDVDIKGQVLDMVEHGNHFAGFDRCRVANFQLTSFTPMPEQSDDCATLSREQLSTLSATIRKGPASVIGFERNGTSQVAFDMGWNAAKEQVWVQLQALGVELPCDEVGEEVSAGVKPKKSGPLTGEELLAYVSGKITDEIPEGVALLARIDSKVERGLQHKVACEILTRLCWVINYGGNLDNLQCQVTNLISSMQDFGQQIRDDISEADGS